MTKIPFDILKKTVQQASAKIAAEKEKFEDRINFLAEACMDLNIIKKPRETGILWWKKYYCPKCNQILSISRLDGIDGNCFHIYLKCSCGYEFVERHAYFGSGDSPM